MYRKPSEAQKRSYKKYIDGTDEIRVRVRKGLKQEIREHIADTGETMQQFIVRVVEQDLNREKHDDTE